MDALIDALSNVCTQLLPILGVAVLITVFILLLEGVKLIKSLNETLSKTHKTIELTNMSIEKVQSPLDTVVKVSATVDKVHDSTVEAFDNAKEYIAEGANIIKEKITEFKNRKDGEIKEPSPEDIIGGNDND